LEERVEIALISVGSEPRWQLPKGMLAPGESNADAARREVREEAGIDTELIAPLDQIEYWYYAHSQGRRIRFHKIVHFFLFRYLSGDPADHDHEVNEARWVEIDQAFRQLNFSSEKNLVAMAREIISALNPKE